MPSRQPIIRRLLVGRVISVRRKRAYAPADHLRQNGCVAIPVTARVSLIILVVLIASVAYSFIDEIGFTTELNWAGLDGGAIVWRHRHAYDVQFYSQSQPVGRSFAGFASLIVPTTKGNAAVPDSYRIIIVPLWPLLVFLLLYPIWIIRRSQRFEPQEKEENSS